VCLRAKSLAGLGNLNQKKQSKIRDGKGAPGIEPESLRDLIPEYPQGPKPTFTLKEMKKSRNLYIPKSIKNPNGGSCRGHRRGPMLSARMGLGFGWSIDPTWSFSCFHTEHPSICDAAAALHAPYLLARYVAASVRRVCRAECVDKSDQNSGIVTVHVYYTFMMTLLMLITGI
jgi:hypothetical protein